MVKINLMPSEFARMRKSMPIELKLDKVLVFLFYFNLIFFLGGITLRLETMFRKIGLFRINREYQQAESLSKKIKALKRQQSELTAESEFLNRYLARDLLWSEKLKQLRSLMPREVWLSQLSFEKKTEKDSTTQTLSLKGSLLPSEELSPIGTLSRFVNKIKEDSAFIAEFDNPVLTDLRAEVYKNKEIMTFLIVMPFKEDKAKL